MRYRCDGAPAIFDAWLDGARGRVLSERERVGLRPFVKTAFGIPGSELPDDHVQGYVAEFLWFLVARDACSPDRTLRHLKGPDFHVTGPGGDGLAVFERDGALAFRLWEIKKHDSRAHVSATVSRAYKQLEANATQYLAQMTSLGKHVAPDLAELFARLVDLWIDADPAAGAGVAVATSEGSLPERCFGRMGDRFPRLTGEDQLEGLVLGLADFPAFSQRVKEIVWSAL